MIVCLYVDRSQFLLSLVTFLIVNHHNLYVIHLNIRSLLPKIDHLRAWFACNSNIITLLETWLAESTTDVSVKKEHFIVYRTDRGSRGGEVAAYMLSSLKSPLITPIVKFELFESVTLHNLHCTYMVYGILSILILKYT